jgi:hypothetical protein
MGRITYDSLFIRNLKLCGTVRCIFDFGLADCRFESTHLLVLRVWRKNRYRQHQRKYLMGRITYDSLFNRNPKLHVRYMLDFGLAVCRFESMHLLVLRVWRKNHPCNTSAANSFLAIFASSKSLANSQYYMYILRRCRKHVRAFFFYRPFC